MTIFADLLQLLGLGQPAAPALPPRLPAAWMGVDRSSARRFKNIPTDLNWFGLLIDNSNLRFAGAYLDGTTFPSGATASQFTNSTKDLNRDWIPNVAALRSQGWGTLFEYVGYSVTQNEPLPSLAQLPLSDYAGRGKLHAQHAKIIISTISPAMDGAVVYFDNEDPEGTNISTLIPYYDAFFDELQIPGPGTAPALRPGIYAHAPIGVQFLNTYPYVFLWEVTYETSTTPVIEAPFLNTDNPILVNPASLKPNRSLGAFTLTNGAQKSVAWSVVRQLRSYSGNMPIAGSAITAAIPALTTYNTWDYDSSLVRDPAYPSADPRFAPGVAPPSSPGSPDSVIVEGKFTTRTAADPPQMTVDMTQPGGHVNIPLLPAQYVEPDAPIAVATFPGAQQSNFATVLTTGDIATCDSAGRTWLNTGSSSTIQARRLRSLAFATFSATDLQVFFVGQDRAIWAIRSTGGTWSAPAQMGGGLRLHPSALLAATSRAGNSVDVFTFNDSGLLTTSWWGSASTTWPDSNSQVLDPSPGLLLPMSALAVVSVSVGKLHVFAIGKDQHLHYVEFTSTTWGTVQTLGAATDFVFAHSRIAALAVSSTVLAVAVIADNGNVRVHILNGSSGTWTEQGPATEFNPPPIAAPAGYTPPAPAVLTETAYGWRINPYSDLYLTLENGITVIYAAGLEPGQTAVLRRSILFGSEWERYR
jgi:hypothetical protein